MPFPFRRSHRDSYACGTAGNCTYLLTAPRPKVGRRIDEIDGKVNRCSIVRSGLTEDFKIGEYDRTSQPFNTASRYEIAELASHANLFALKELRERERGRLAAMDVENNKLTSFSIPSVDLESLKNNAPLF